ncbi:hypothetical protein NP233_g9074 [Leucocoprinus birnbaumii]|uniref:Uncharacterized protein n=1 Tax=Leucocoprinus birnbaumii TaxID=56174 RepID=A0AAD5VNJ3_9AGAR|nr:hypothetical protein NP233_g9074 [Leucocoprinus birnbaumii]
MSASISPGTQVGSLPMDQYEKSGNPVQVPNPSHRHAGPSAPWPWVDLADEIEDEVLNSELPAIPPPCNHLACDGKCWKEYPESRFPNWRKNQVEKCKIQGAIEDNDKKCTLYYVDVDADGNFRNAPKKEITKQSAPDDWDFFIQDEVGLNRWYNIEPFFWSSSLNWIPSRYQEDPQNGKGDHITICLTFLRSMPADADAMLMDAGRTDRRPSVGSADHWSIQDGKEINTQIPLPLKSAGRILVQDLLSVHLIRITEGSTIISYHPDLPLPTTTAKDLHRRIRFAGQSVYWQKIFQTSTDPTFVLLTFLWHALYAWDEAFEHLYKHIVTLESHVVKTNQMALTSELHVIRAHQLHFSALLANFAKSVKFIRDTEHPGLQSLSKLEKDETQKRLEQECAMLLSEIERLDMTREIQDKRVKNVMNLVFSTVNIKDSNKMQEMTEAAVRDSAAYLTMVFLPSSFVAVRTRSLSVTIRPSDSHPGIISCDKAVFGMNVQEIVPQTNETLGRYIGVALALTLVTIWIIIAFQSQYLLPKDYSFFKRLGWPVLLAIQWIQEKYKSSSLWRRYRRGA